jgi:signal transduction histidine kinase
MDATHAADPARAVRDSHAQVLVLALAALLALLGWLVLGNPFSVAREVADPAARLIDQADVLEDGPVQETVGAVPPASAPWRGASLPDNWDGRRPGFDGQVWYRLSLPSGQPGQRRAAYLPAAGMNAEIWFDGQRLGTLGRLRGPVTRHFYTPLLVELPPLGAGELVVRVAGHPGYRCGLAPLWVGPYDPLYDAWRRRDAWQGLGTLVTIVFNLAIGVYVLLIAWRERSHGAYAWFGAAAVVWGLRNLNYVVTDPPTADLLWAELCVSGAAWFTGLFAIFAMKFTEAELPGYRGPRWLPPLAIAYAGAATVHFLSAPTYGRANAGFAVLAAVGIALTVWSQWRLLRLAWTLRRVELTAVGLGALTYLVLLVHDYRIGIDDRSLGEVYLRQYAALPLFVAITATLARRYLRALARERQFSAELQAEVETQRQQLERSFAQLREAEHERTREQERSRLLGDLHDGLGLHLVTALRQARQPGTPREAVAATLQDCLDDLRVAIDSLDASERDPVALLGTLRWRMGPRFESLGLRLAWDVADDLPPLPALDAGDALQLLRIVQEALTNALKHSGAATVTLAVATAGGRTRVEVRDDGCGLAADTAAAGRGLGHMRARARRIGADLEIGTLPGGGTVVRLLLAGQARPAP